MAIPIYSTPDVQVSVEPTVAGEKVGCFTHSLGIKISRSAIPVFIMKTLAVVSCNCI